MCTTYEYQCHVQILVMLLHEFPIVLIGLLAVGGKEVCAGIIGPQRIEELFESGMETIFGCQQRPG